MNKLLFILFFTTNLIFCQSQGKSEQRFILSGGIAHIGDGTIIENSTIIIENGKIIAIGDSDLVIVNKDRGLFYDITGKHVYPSFILPNSTLGLVEIDAVRATRDEREVGDLNPNVRSQIAYNTESVVSSTVRTNGILLAQITPRGGLIGGMSSIMKLDGWNWEDATYLKDDGIHLYWPEKHDFKYHGHSHVFTSSDETEHIEENDEIQESIKELDDLFRKSVNYSKLNQLEQDLRLQSLVELTKGEKKLYIHVNGVNGIKESVYFAKKHNINDIVLVGASESWRITDFILEHNIPIILGRIHSLPNFPEDDIDQPFKTPKILADAGILFCLDYSGDMPRMGARNLPFLAGTAAAYGLDKEEALKLITYNTAKILGIDNITGTLETGKDANLFVSNGDALDMITNDVEIIFLMGKVLKVENHQTKLYEKFSNKFKLKK